MTLLPRLPPHAEATIHQFLRAHVAAAGGQGVVIGLSGGVDSALVARLARDALGPERVLGVALPDRSHPAELLAETREYAASLGVATQAHAIDPVLDALHGLLPDETDRTTWGNATARVRMIVLYTIARSSGRLVAGTGNKSELLLGYFTKYGDGGVDLLPIGDLYKTEVWSLAEQLDLPAPIRERPPTAGLWEGQTDEEDLGMPYRAIDQILRGVEELRSTDEIVAATGLRPEQVEGIERRVVANRHKRRPPPIPKLSLRTVGIDWHD